MINFIVDIDGTIADHSHRALLLRSTCLACGNITQETKCVCGSDLLDYTRESFDSFLEPSLMSLDVPIASAQRVISLVLKEPRKYTVNYITGRIDAKHRDVTTAWLQSHFNFSEKVSTLYMRSNYEQDMCPSDYKETKFNKMKTKLSGDFFFFDDDPFVQTMYASHGIVFRAPDCWDSFMPKGLNRRMEKKLSR